VPASELIWFEVSESVIDISELTRRFGAKTALASVSLSLPRGAVYGLVGANGAGKTTLIKHILGLLRAESGSVRVFGLDPVADPVAVLSRTGYLSEENDLPGWMRVDESPLGNPMRPSQVRAFARRSGLEAETEKWQGDSRCHQFLVPILDDLRGDTAQDGTWLPGRPWR
jgi:ABC-type transport system involved in cytochrome bd biosynthesis fused ATPase/permease subunit